MRTRLTFVVALSLAVLVVEATAAAGSNNKPPPPPDGGFAPLAGDCGAGGGNCTLNGCPAKKSCVDGIWVCDTYTGTGSKSCTACGQSGTQACTINGPSPTCSVSTTTQACGMADGCPGTQTCNTVPGGTWNACGYTGSGSRGCNACGQSGTQACGGSGPYGNCNVSIMSQGCTNGCGSGTPTCNNVPGGTWNACVVADRACGTAPCGGTQACVNGAWGACSNCPSSATCDTSSSIACGTHGSITCGACQPTGSCVVQEACNNCDDNGDGRIDEGQACSPCGL